MLSDIIAPGRLRDGDPQALAALVAVGGWSVVTYCERAGAGAHVAQAAVLALVLFRRRVIHAADGAAGDLERLLLESARDAVDELRGEAPAAEQSRAAQDAFARATPRPLSARLATRALHALVEAAPVAGDPSAVRAAAERGYCEAYGAAVAAPAVAGEDRLDPASPLLLEAAASSPATAASASALTPGVAEAQASAAPRARVAARTGRPALTALRRVPPAWRAVACAAALVLLVLVFVSGDDGQPRSAPAPESTTVTVTKLAPRPATDAAPAQVVRGRPRRPLTASGARFEVVPISDAAWAREIRARRPRPSHRWVTIAVRTRNVSRRDLVLRSLGYRLRTASGLVVGPLLVDVAEAPRQAREGRLAVGARASVHLGFEVAQSARSLTFVFEPGGLGEPAVLVALGDLR